MSTLRRIVESGELEAVLAEAIANGDRRAEIRSRSYKHSNGFLKVVLAADRQRTNELRMHSWTRSDGLAGDRHTHPWSFASYVLKGVLINEIFEEERGDVYTRLNIGPVGEGRDGYNIIADGRCDLVCVARTTLTTGSEYYLDPALIHNAYSPEGAITLMRQGTFCREVTRGYRRGELRRDQEGVVRLEDDELLQTLRDALACVT